MSDSKAEPPAHAGQTATDDSAGPKRDSTHASPVLPPRFEVVRKLGEGSFGEVFEARDRERGSALAVKALRRLDGGAILRFKNEFRALAGIVHPNLVRVHELLCVEDRWFIAMELVAGTDFIDHAQLGEGREVPRLRDALWQLTTGLDALHRAGQLHRDLKPANVKVTREGRVVLLDFGLLEQLAPGGVSESSPEVAGTPAYMAPEQAAGRVLSPAADWYAVGVMLYEALTGQLPFAGSAMEIALQKRSADGPDPRTVAPDSPADLAELCLGLLRRDPDARLGAAEVLRLAPAAPERAQPIEAPAARSIDERHFVGRASELQRLSDAFATARQSGARALLVEGESGIGKTSLARHFVEAVQQDPKALVLWGRCYDREAVPFKGVDGLVDALTRHLSRLEEVEAALLMPRHAACLLRLFPVMSRLQFLSRDLEVPADPKVLRERAFRALRELLSRASDRGPALLVVDDFQWADRDSVLLFGELLRGLDPPRVLLLLLSRPGATVVDAIKEELGAAAQSIRLTGLDAPDAAALAVALGGRATDASTAARESAGNPMFLEQLVRHAAHGEAGTRLEDVLRLRLGQLSASEQALLQLHAISVLPLAPEILAKASGLPKQESNDGLDRLLSAKFLKPVERGLECYHDRIREAVAASLEPEQVRALHRRLATALEAGGADPRVLARHFEAAGDPRRAAECAVKAAERAAETFAFDLSAELYAMALRLGDWPPDVRRGLLMSRGETLAYALRGVEAADAFSSACEGADEATALTCKQRVAENLIESGRFDVGLAALTQALAAEGESLPTARGAKLSLVWNLLRLKARGWKYQARNPNEVSPRQRGLLRMLAVASVAFTQIDPLWGVAIGLRFAVLALASGVRWAMAYAFGFEAVVRAMGGQAAAADRFLTEASRLAHEDGEPFTESFSKAWVAFFLGRMREAREEFLEAERRYDPRRSNGWGLPRAVPGLLRATSFVGEYRELVRLTEGLQRDAERRNDEWAQVDVLRERNLAYLVRDLPDHAGKALERKWRLSALAGENTLQEWLECMARTELALYAGDRSPLLELQARFGRLRRKEGGRLRFLQWMGAHYSGLIAIATSDGEGAEASARELEHEGLELTGAYATLLRALAAGVRGDAAAEGLWRKAIAQSDVRGLQGLAAAARRRLGEQVGGAEGVELISRADGWLASQGVVDPVRFTRMLAPLPFSLPAPL